MASPLSKSGVRRLALPPGSPATSATARATELQPLAAYPSSRRSLPTRVEPLASSTRQARETGNPGMPPQPARADSRRRRALRALVGLARQAGFQGAHAEDATEPSALERAGQGPDRQTRHSTGRSPQAQAPASRRPP